VFQVYSYCTEYYQHLNVGLFLKKGKMISNQPFLDKDIYIFSLQDDRMILGENKPK